MYAHTVRVCDNHLCNAHPGMAHGVCDLQFSGVAGCVNVHIAFMLNNDGQVLCGAMMFLAGNPPVATR